MDEEAGFNDGPGTCASELKSVGKENGKDLFHKGGITLNRGQRMDAPFYRAAFGFGFEAVQHFLDERSQRSGQDCQLMPSEPGQFFGCRFVVLCYFSI